MVLAKNPLWGLIFVALSSSLGWAETSSNESTTELTEELIEQAPELFPQIPSLIQKHIQSPEPFCGEVTPPPTPPSKKQTTPLLFQEEAPLKISLTFDEKKLAQFKGADEKAGKVGALLQLSDGTPLKIEVSKRGNSRLDACQKNPPLKIHFTSQNEKTDKKGTPFQGVGSSLKLVLPCYEGYKGTKTSEQYGSEHSDYEEMVKREYWIYKMIEASGLSHFKVRRVNLNLNGKQMPAFFIENIKTVVNREGGVRAPPPAQPTEKGRLLKAENTLYNALSGSQDSDVQGQNTKTYMDAQGDYHLVQYDFDLSPLVDSTWDGWGHHLDLEDLSDFVENRFDHESSQKLKTVVEHKENIFNTIDRSDLSAKDKENFRSYYKKVLGIFEAHLKRVYGE